MTLCQLSFDNFFSFRVECFYFIVQLSFFLIYHYVCECTIGVDVGDGTTTFLLSVLPIVVVGCIVLEGK